MSGIIEVENLSFGYTPRSAILKDISFEVKAGAFLAIAGPNGAGKTTLLNLLCGLLRPEAGSIRIDAAHIESYAVKELAQIIAVVRQEFVPVFDFSVTEVVSMARTPYWGTFGFESKTDRKIVDEALKATDTTQFAPRSLGTLSGGERQRVFIARALAQNTAILLLDEPTSFLDLKHQVGIYDLLKAAQLEKGKTIVAVTHDINLAAQYCDEILLLGGAPESEMTQALSGSPMRPKPQNATQARSNYRVGKTTDVFSPEQIEQVFGVRVFAGNVGQEKFFMPLGRFAKDTRQIDKKPANHQAK